MNPISSFLFPLSAIAIATITTIPLVAFAQTSKAKPIPAKPANAPVRKQPVGLPQDAGAHDADAAIEWWYFNTFLKSESGKNYAVVGSFFRTGLQPTKKGHYLIYSLTDLDTNTVVAHGSVLDKSNVALMKAYLPLVAMQRPDDPTLMPLLAAIQKDTLPPPHRIAGGNTVIQLNKPRFRIGMDNNKSTFVQQTDDARTWKATLSDKVFSTSLTFTQPKSARPPMLVGGKGMTGLGSPDDMFYVSLTRPGVTGTLTVGGKTEKVTGTGWIDRQWGRSWIVGNNGWDWFGVHLDDGSDLIVYRIKDNNSGKVLRAEATLLRPDGIQSVDKSVRFATDGEWLDPETKIVFPQTFTVEIPKLGYALTFTPKFDAQAIPTLGIGAAFWEGVVLVTGTHNGQPITGRGYRELVGYKAKPAPASAKAQTP